MRHVFKNVYCGSVVGTAAVPARGNFRFPEFNELKDRPVRGIGFFTFNNLRVDANGQQTFTEDQQYWLTLVSDKGEFIFKDVNLALLYVPLSLNAQSAGSYRFDTRTNFFYFKNPVVMGWRNCYVRGALNENVNIPFVIDYD